MLLYLVAGVAGVPWFAEQRIRLRRFPSFGYIIGFVAAASVVGALASRGADRTVERHRRDHGAGQPDHLRLRRPLAHGVGRACPCSLALEAGLWPFVIGDALKIALAAGLLPLTWRLVGRHD